MLRRILRLLTRAGYQAVVAVAVLATLTTSFGIHLHQAGPGPAAEACADHASHVPTHVASTFSPRHGTQAVDLGHDEPAADGGCGSCHCHMPGTTVAVLNPLTWFSACGYSAILRQTHDLAIPDSLSFEPDPPPIRG